jgi:DNA/RNA endonuclease G (NUC1)
MILYLDSDTSTLISKQTLKWINFKHLNKVERCECWFDDTYKGKYLPVKYKKSRFDKGHLTPSHITTYDRLANRNSFSMFNEAPQYAYFNRHSWKDLEISIEDTITKYKKDAIIITGVVYNENKKTYLPKSRIKIPTHYFKIVTIGKKSWYWIGVNSNDKQECIIKETNLKDLNILFKKNSMKLRIK